MDAPRVITALPQVELHRAWLGERYILAPPDYGRSDETSVISAAATHQMRKMDLRPVHTQYVLHVSGTARSPPNIALHVSVHIRNALWRTYVHHLCTSLDESPRLEHRHCRTRGGPFNASVFLFVPGRRPRITGPSLISSAKGNPMAAAHLLLDSFDICDRRSRLAEAPAKSLTLCNGRANVPLRHLLSEPRFRELTSSQTPGPDWTVVGSAFVLAARTLPQPFTIIESGNLCGATTVMLALLKRHICPTCPKIVSMDPGGYRRSQGMTMSCARDAIAWAGVEDDVDLRDELTATVEVELPVGFVFLDDGKIRFANDPLLALLEPKIMRGAIISMHDAYRSEPDSRLSVGHAGQATFADELAKGGMFVPLVLPRQPVRGAIQRKVAGHLAPIATHRGDPFGKFRHHVVVMQRSSGPKRGDLPSFESSTIMDDTVRICAKLLRADGSEGTHSELSISLPQTDA